MGFLQYLRRHKARTDQADKLDPLAYALEQKGIEVNHDWLFEVECELAVRGVDKHNITYAVAFYQAYAEAKAHTSKGGLDASN